MKTALVIDDDPIVLTLLARTLEDAGWDVLKADAGDTGVALAIEHRPELIVTDLLMPRFNGYQVCRAIRSAQTYFPQPRIIVVSSSNYATDRANSIDAGADDFLLKPIKPVDLLHLLDIEGGTTFLRRSDLMGSKSAAPPDTAFFRHAIGSPPTVQFWGVRGSIAFIPDNEPHSRLRMAPVTDSTQSHEVLAYAQKQDEKLIEFIRDCDVVIMDSQYDGVEYKSHIGWGHTCVDDAVALAVIANVKKLFLFHHDPDHDDAKVESMEEWARELAAIHGSNLQVDAAREGVKVVLNRATA